MIFYANIVIVNRENGLKTTIYLRISMNIDKNKKILLEKHLAKL